MAQLAQTVSLDTVSANEVRALERLELSKIAQGADELGQLGRVFQKMVREIATTIGATITVPVITHAAT